MLDIVITHYTEPWGVCRPLFETLDAQRGVDWDQIRVTVVNDGSKGLPQLMDGWNFRVNQLVIPHGGVSAARNAGIRHAQEPWIMFCDCDDCFSNVFALEDILNVLKDDGRYDMMWTKVWAEKEEDGKHIVYQIQDQKIMVFVHGKVYRREFLLSHGVWFDEELTFNEDSLFNATIMTQVPNTRIGEITTFAPAYVWTLREGSVTTGEGAEDRSALGQFMRNMKVAELYRRFRPEGYPGMVTRVIYDTFYMTHTRKYSPSCKQEILDGFLPWVEEKLDLFCQVKEDELFRIRMISRSELTEPDEEICDEPGNVRAWVEWELKR